MKNTLWYKDPFHWLLLLGYTILAGVSFLTISTVFHQELTSDQTIQVLMANDFSWGHDLYYWGQTRLGSFLPALSSIFVSAMPAHPLVVVSILQYLLVFFGFLLLTSDLKNRWLQLAFAGMWFLPFPFFAWNLFIGQPYTSQFFLLGLCLFFLKQSEKTDLNSMKRNLLVACSLLSWMLSAWVNDIMIALLPVFLLYFSSPKLSSENSSGSFDIRISLPKSFSRAYLLFAASAIILGAGFILYAKAQASWYQDHAPTLSSFGSILDAIRSLFKTIYKASTFQVRNVLISFHTNLLLLSLLIAFFPVKRKVESPSFSFRNPWLLFLLLSLCSLLIVISSRWVEINQYDTRYYCLPYYLFLLALGYRIVSISSPLKRNVLITCVCLAAILSSTTSLLYHQGTQPGDKSFSFQEQLVLSKRLGDCAVIGNYRNSYSLAAGDPDNIVATPHEKDHVRNSRCVEAMLKKQKVFLVGNGWLDVFPDTVSQFGRTLVRVDKPFWAEHLKICEYR